MREIKFRGKNYGGIWLYGYLMPAEKPVINKGCKYRISVSPQSCAGKDKMVYEIISDTIGQYTGLKDKNGKEIYEGDILRVEEFWNESGPIEISEEFLRVFDLEDLKGEKQREYTTPVSWEDGAFVISVNRKGDTDLSALFGDMRLSFPIFVFEVIGNIYDNPELVEG